MHANMSFKTSFIEKPSVKWILFVLWTLVIIQLLCSNLRYQQAPMQKYHDIITSRQKSQPVYSGLCIIERTIKAIKRSFVQDNSSPKLFGVIFAEAGKKKKKEKSEVVVISVNNPSKGHGGMYPVYIPSCFSSKHY